RRGSLGPGFGSRDGSCRDANAVSARAKATRRAPWKLRAFAWAAASILRGASSDQSRQLEVWGRRTPPSECPPLAERKRGGGSGQGRDVVDAEVEGPILQVAGRDLPLDGLDL